MNNQLTLSVVIPTYNMERFLNRCLSSVCIKKFIGQIEVILVNDGSTDSSLAIATSFNQSFPELLRVIDKPNGNYGSCINAALDLANGKYIKILDADDCFDPIGFEKFVDYISKIDVDLILSDFDMVDEKGKVIRHYKYPYKLHETYPVTKLNEPIEMWMHAVAYRTDNLREIQYSQTEGVSYTDQEWLFLPMSTVNTFSYFPKTVYRYTVGRSGQTIDPDVFIRKIDDEITGFRVMLNEYLEGQWTNEHDRYLTGRLLTRAGTIYSAFLIYYLGGMNMEKLVSLDKFISDKSQRLYYLTNNINPPFKLLKYKYIHDWRKNGYRISLMIRILHYIKKIRRKICRK